MFKISVQSISWKFEKLLKSEINQEKIRKTRNTGTKSGQNYGNVLWDTF